MLRLDHVVLAVADIDAAASRLFDEFGLASVPGGSHDGVGTANRIVPLGETYVELMGIIDRDVAAQNPLGRYLGSFLEGGDRLLMWAVATDDIDWDAKRIGTKPNPWARHRPDGVELTWRLAGVEGALADRSLPFFIQWDSSPDQHPGRDHAAHATDIEGITDLEVGGKAPVISRRLGGADLPVTVVKGGDSGPRAVTISTGAGEVVLR
jgi:hypothetical protein